VTSTGVSRQKNATRDTAELIDRAEALARVDGDRELMASLVKIFLTEASPMMEAILTAVKSGDAGKLEKSAHRLKGSVSIFGANTISQTALELEKQGHDGDLTKISETAARLEQQMASLQPALKQFHSELQLSR
jgi:HPt (histidine-containing phosphotransfer) domain-containing protein